MDCYISYSGSSLVFLVFVDTTYDRTEGMCFVSWFHLIPYFLTRALTPGLALLNLLAVLCASALVFIGLVSLRLVEIEPSARMM